MHIIKADAIHKREALKLLDNFREDCMQQISPGSNFISTTAQDNGADLYDTVVNSDTGAIFLAIHDNRAVGIVTVYKIPQIRKGICVAEIEEMYVENAFRGTGVSKMLMDSVAAWAESQGIETIRLESNKKLERAHSFYTKYGFKNNSMAFEYSIEK